MSDKNQETIVTSAIEEVTQEEPVIKPSWFWIKDSKGNASVTTTFVSIAFFVTTLAYVFSIVEKIGSITIRSFDVAACTAYFTPLLALYFGRRWTEKK